MAEQEEINPPKEYHWFKVFAAGKGSQNFVKPGKVRAAIVRDQKLCFAMKEGKTYAFSPKCPHNGFSLEKGMFDEKGDIVCPLHRFSFCIATGENTSGEGFHLPNYPVEFREDGMYVGFEKPARKKRKGWFW